MRLPHGSKSRRFIPIRSEIIIATRRQNSFHNSKRPDDHQLKTGLKLGDKPEREPPTMNAPAFVAPEAEQDGPFVRWVKDRLECFVAWWCFGARLLIANLIVLLCGLLMWLALQALQPKTVVSFASVQLEQPCLTVSIVIC